MEAKGGCALKTTCLRTARAVSGRLNGPICLETMTLPPCSGQDVASRAGTATMSALVGMTSSVSVHTNSISHQVLCRQPARLPVPRSGGVASTLSTTAMKEGLNLDFKHQEDSWDDVSSMISVLQKWAIKSCSHYFTHAHKSAARLLPEETSRENHFRNDRALLFTGLQPR